jgi:hypothetical protein
MLYNPITNIEQFGYRYCRNDQCGRADDSFTAGNSTTGRTVTISGGTQTVEDTIESWYWMQPDDSSRLFEFPEVKPRGESFITGIQFQPYYHPSFTPRLPITYSEIDNMQANWVFLSPTWTFTRQNPPILEFVTGKDQYWADLSYATEKAQAFDLKVGYNPTPNFSNDMEDWWSNSQRDFPWWQVWFERYRNFILTFADKAQQDGAKGLVLGGDWVSPALPEGVLSDGSRSGVPADAEKRWREIISEVKVRFQGQLYWALPAAKSGINPPPFIEDLDHIYLLWSLPLRSQTEATDQQLRATAAEYLDSEVFLLKISLEMPVTIAAAYPSADGSLDDCILISNEVEETSCYNPKYLEPPFPDNPAINLDLDEQYSAYQALLISISEREWIDGFVSRGFYPPAELRDKSASIYGKPVQSKLSEWYSRFIPQPSP